MQIKLSIRKIYFLNINFSKFLMTFLEEESIIYVILKEGS